MDQSLYQQLILDHNRSPKNFGELDNPTHSSEGYNALCGDHFFVHLNWNDEQEVIEEIKFSGQGCAISKASASMMSELLLEKNKKEVLELFNLFKKMIKGETLDSLEEEKMGKLIIFTNIHKYPSRVKCALLSWYTAVAALEKKRLTNSEET